MTFIYDAVKCSTVSIPSNTFQLMEVNCSGISNSGSYVIEPFILENDIEFAEVVVDADRKRFMTPVKNESYVVTFLKRRSELKQISVVES